MSGGQNKQNFEGGFCIYPFTQSFSFHCSLYKKNKSLLSLQSKLLSGPSVPYIPSIALVLLNNLFAAFPNYCLFIQAPLLIRVIVVRIDGSKRVCRKAVAV